jgi:GT2 family glycosyltransferase
MAGQNPQPAATVVVPTRDRPAQLARCLSAIRRQTLADLELVVVDDASRDSAAVERVVAAHAPARLVRADGQGPAAARNIGASLARGDVICFTDDDCEPDLRWAERLVVAVSESGAPAAGRTRNGLRDNPFSEASHTILEYLQLASAAPGGRLAFAPSCNLACPAAIARRIPFDESYRLPAGEDRDWTRRAARSAVSPIYVANAVAVHRHGLTPGEFLRQHFAYGRGAAQFARGAGRESLLGVRARLALAREGLRRGARVGALVCVAQLVTAAAFLLAVLGLRRSASAQATSNGSPGRSLRSTPLSPQMVAATSSRRGRREGR